MGRNNNIGLIQSLTVYGNPVSFQKHINAHGQLCKIKQSIACPNCAAVGHGSPDYNCTICDGNGYIYTYQRKFLITDEETLCNDTCTEFYPWYTPVLEVVKVEKVTPEIQGGIRELPVLSFTDEIIFTDNSIVNAKIYERKRVTYFYDGWTYVEGDVLEVDVENGLMWPTETYKNLEYQSSNPIKGEADICQINRIYNSVTGVEITDYTQIGNTIKTKNPIVSGQMVADYYYSDLTQVITSDLRLKNENEQWTHELINGEVRMAFYPWMNISKGDIIILVASVLYRTEVLTHLEDLDQLWEIEVFDINDLIIDSSGNIYYKGTDFILVGNRYISWLTNKKPVKNSAISVRYGYKPAYICFDDNPEPNNLENRRYPKIINAKNWTKTSRDDIKKLITDV